MTLDHFTRALSIGAIGLLLLVVPFQLWLVRDRAPAPVKWIFGFGLVAAGTTLFLAVAWAPRAVRLVGQKLSVERLWWSSFDVPLRTVTSVEAGPPITLAGAVRRVAGNGGLIGYTGLYHVRGVGLVRCWATRLGRDTVLLRRRGERPILLGVDDPAGLTAAIQRAL